MLTSNLITFYTLLTPTTIVSNSTGQLLPVASAITPGVYQHYKGNYYQVFFVARHTETEQEMVVYQSLYGDYRIWVRPLAMFQEKVEYNGAIQPRFTWIAQSSETQRFIDQKF